MSGNLTKWSQKRGCDTTYRARSFDTPYARVHPAFRPFLWGAMRARIHLLLSSRPKSAISCARQWRAVRGVVMNRIKLSIRVPAAQEIMLRHIAEVRGLTRYQALARVIETGLGAIMHTPAPSTNGTGDDALALLDTRLSVIEALTDRSLFTASAA